jgi:adenylate cyclase
MSKLQSSFSIKRSLRVDMLTAFGGLLLATVLVVIIYFYSNTSRVVLMLCDDLVEQTTQAVINRTVNFFTPVTALTKMSSQIAAAGILPLGNSAGLERYAIEVLNAYPPVAGFIIGDKAGNFLMVRRLPDGTTSTKIMDRTADPPLTAWRTRDKAFNLINAENTTTDTFDPRLRPWYQGAKDDQGLYVTDVYIFYTNRVPGITVSYPVLDSEGSVLAVLGCDIELSGLSTFLRSLRISEHGLAFIINEKNELVAFPDAARVIDNQIEYGVLRTVSVEDLEILSITDAFRKHRSSGAARVTVEIGGSKYLATFRDFPPSFIKPWKVIVVVPEDDFIGDVKKINQGVFLICLGILGAATLLVVLLSRSISKPILLLAAETDRIRNFQLDGQFHLHTHISEIQHLQGAVDRMKAGLRSFTRFAPEQIVREVVVKGEEAMLGGERREVTLLFSDLRNFTRFSERTRPEHVVQILNTHFDTLVRIITQYQGFVVDFLGDSLFAVFGAPEKDPNHARQAVSCAIDMQLAQQQMNSDLACVGMPVMEMGIGINSGPCVVGNMGSRMRIKYGVVGHAVNLASRLESFTVGGQVLISESTHQGVSDQFEVAGPLEAYGKGVESAIRLWEVRGVLNDVNKRLPATISNLKWLITPVPVHIRLITNKQTSSSLYEGRLIQLSSTGAELETNLSLEIFASLQVEIPCPLGKSILVDGKVVFIMEPQHSYLIRFSELDEASATALNFWLT